LAWDLLGKQKMCQPRLDVKNIKKFFVSASKSTTYKVGGGGGGTSV